jgi:hypothetical protein
MTAAPFDVKKMCCRVRDIFFSGGSKVCEILRVPAAFSDSYFRRRFSSLRQLEESPPDLCDVPASHRDLPHVLIWKVHGL